MGLREYNQPFAMEPFHPLSHPVGAILRHAESVGPNDSLARAAWVLRESSAGIVPVVEDGKLVGAVTDRTLAATLESGMGSLSSVSAAMVTHPQTIPSFASGAEALRRLSDADSPVLIVVDGQGHYLGVLSASDLFPRHDIPPILPMIGGMATPFGVYLTAAGVRAGAGPIALVATGMLLSSLILGGAFLGEWLAELASSALGLQATPSWMINVFPLLIFMAALRSIPLAGTHAAEHKVVHALENGEPLELEVVKRMPRVHPRCGTNLAVGLSLFLGLAGWQWTAVEQWRILVAMLATLILWRPFGNLMQLVVTTKPPSERQLLNGIAAGRELIRNVQAHRRQRRTVWQRIMASGMLHVMAGSALVVALVQLVAWLFGLNLGIELV